ncbi:hypothetical protein GCK72_018767 [Caenorhabditis remanei]|nr:hypothetical protein GCK72_018767 [Caenorhabditis remanei]KAF1752213.1 hypothetical protein GCK72_018767 [Caenorhabditis remanei]
MKKERTCRVIKLQKSTKVSMEVMRIEEIETTDKKIKRTWSYEKKDVLKDIESEKSQASPCVKDRVESEINLMKNNSYISKVS